MIAPLVTPRSLPLRPSRGPRSVAAGPGRHQPLRGVEQLDAFGWSEAMGIPQTSHGELRGSLDDGKKYTELGSSKS